MKRTLRTNKNKNYTTDVNNLIKILCSTISKLKKKGVIRDDRSIIGNIGEYQCARLCELKLNKKTNERYFDATTKNREKVQIKSSTTNTFYRIRDDMQYKWLYLVQINKGDLHVQNIYKVSSENIVRLLTREPYEEIFDLSVTHKGLKEGLIQKVWSSAGAGL